MRRLVFLSAIFATSTFSLMAANDPIAQRKEILKGMGDATKPVVAMIKEQTPFDRAKVEIALASYADGASKLPSLFPDDSKVGGKTRALPKIWEDKSKFESLYKKLGADAKAAQGAIADVANLKGAFPKILGDCKNCHDDYREKE